MLTTSRAVIVEGKYDKIRLSSVIDALIITTEGFGIFSDKEKQKFIKKTAAEKGLLIITDSDAAGFKIRNFLKNIVPEDRILHAYIPDIYGKEKRKDAPSKEGKLGVEGIDTKTLEDALAKSGLFRETVNDKKSSERITTADIFEAGLTGGANAAEKRRKLLIYAGLPARLTGKNFLQVINSFFTRSDFFALIEQLFPVDTGNDPGYN